MGQPSWAATRVNPLAEAGKSSAVIVGSASAPVPIPIICAKLAAHDDNTSPGPEPGDGTLGRIALKQVRVKRPDIQERSRATKTENPGNALVPYLDLFGRLDDEELARLAGTKVGVVHQLRSQIDEINEALKRYVDLLPRLTDNELNRLTGASAKTIRFWRLCQPRVDGETPGPRPSKSKPAAATPATSQSRHVQSAAGMHTPGVPAQMGVTRTPPPVDRPPSRSSAVPQPRDARTDQTPQPSPGFEHGAATPDKGGEVSIGVLRDSSGPERVEEIEATVEDMDAAADQVRTIEEIDAALDEIQQVEETGEHEPVKKSDEEEDLAFELSDDDFF